MLELPRAPHRLHLPVERRWDGSADPGGLRCAIDLAAVAGGLWVGASLEQSGPVREPPEPRGTRIDGLWEFDVAECFLVGEDGHYFELELGPGGHFLALSFAKPRQRSYAHEGLALDVRAERSETGWNAETVVPREILPARLCAVNAFAIAAGRYFAHQPVPGTAPDFHQPSAFPGLRVPANW